jgi:hypothetical protein
MPPHDLSRGHVTGDAVTVADSVAIDSANGGAFSISSTGVVAYRAGGANQRQLIWFDQLRPWEHDGRGRRQVTRACPFGSIVVNRETLRGFS